MLVLLLSLVPVTTRGTDNWVEVRSPHFTVTSNAGEREARKVADQFEQIRLMFHTAFAALKVDPPQPIIIIAAKNENTMKLYLPEEWEVKGHIHPAGMYQAGQDKDYVILRLDTEGTNPFHTLYHEYTHALLRLNFDYLPVWLNEGLAEFFGNSTLGDKEIRTGSIDPSHLYILGERKLIPIQTLLEVDHNSPYYNESDRASVFYAESWAVVHYLMMDPEARQKQLLKSFLAAFNKSGDQVAAATEALGDLKKFGGKIESYARQRSFQVGVVKVGKESSDTKYTTRIVSVGEVLALRGDFYTHHNRLEQALPILEEALKNEPNLPIAHEAMGFYRYLRQETKAADDEMVAAMKLGSTGFAPRYFHGLLLLREGGISEDSIREARSNLEKAIQTNPQFAPAYEALSHTYPHTAEGQKLAVDAAARSVQLDPGTPRYSVNLTYLLINSDRDAEARILVKRLLASAGSPGEKEIANNVQSYLQQHEEWLAKKQAADATGPTKSAADSLGAATGAWPRVGISNGSEEYTIRMKGHAYAVDGPISDADCTGKPEITINLDLRNGPVTFHAVDFGKVSVSWADGVSEPSLGNCEQWKGRQVKVWFSATPGKEYAGEITKLYFF
jgi:tetratricopeptide (TPR) repeat protein